MTRFTARLGTIFEALGIRKTQISPALGGPNPPRERRLCHPAGSSATSSRPQPCRDCSERRRPETSRSR